MDYALDFIHITGSNGRCFSRRLQRGTKGLEANEAAYMDSRNSRLNVDGMGMRIFVGLPQLSSRLMIITCQTLTQVTPVDPQRDAKSPSTSDAQCMHS